MCSYILWDIFILQFCSFKEKKKQLIAWIDIIGLSSWTTLTQNLEKCDLDSSPLESFEWNSLKFFLECIKLF